MSRLSDIVGTNKTASPNGAKQRRFVYGNEARYWFIPPYVETEYYQFARQCGCTHLIIHLANYYTSDTNVVTATDDKINYGYSQAGDPIWELDSLLRIKQQAG